MRNDEKIDINLATEGTSENLSEEELAQQNYETALRYINIAEHMNKFEDQDKYYHRAIQYLKKAKPYKKVQPLLRELRNKKFGTRAAGKIELYKEACHIRDNAKTPSDYYSAQTIFSRIYHYEEKHPLIEKWTDPEVYAEAIKCSDSKKQMELCAKLADEKAAQLKRHSFFVSCAFIACLLAALFFTRTVSFKQCLASINSSSGNYEKAWQNYQNIYNRTNSKDAFEKYIEYRYKSAEKALKKISFAYMDWRVLDKQDGKVLLLKDNSLGSTPFDETGKNVTWKSSSVRKWLNGDFLNDNFFKAEQNAILDTTVKNTANPVYNTPAGKDTTDKLFLLSCDEVAQYKKGIHKTKSCWWLRTPGAAANSMSFVYKDKTVMEYGYEVTNTKITVKPAIWVTVE